MDRRAGTALLILAATALGALAVRATWSAERPTAPEIPPTLTLVDNEPWARLLARYVTPDAKFDYRALLENREDRSLLTSWLRDQGQIAVSRLRRDAQKAFWINLYNAATVELILRHYPVDSILKLGMVPGRAWKWEFVRADGRLLSLDAIEHEILRAQFRDPRIHFAINCASASCPPLRRLPYRASDLDEQLDDATRDYLASPEGLSVRMSGREVVATASKIFDWFREDFDAEGGVVRFLTRYAPEETSSLLRRARGSVDVRYGSYDWTLNAPEEEQRDEAAAGRR